MMFKIDMSIILELLLNHRRLLYTQILISDMNFSSHISCYFLSFKTSYLICSRLKNELRIEVKHVLHIHILLKGRCLHVYVNNAHM
jgi:hypothetical protein